MWIFFQISVVHISTQKIRQSAATLTPLAAEVKVIDPTASLQVLLPNLLPNAGKKQSATVKDKEH